MNATFSFVLALSLLLTNFNIFSPRERTADIRASWSIGEEKTGLTGTTKQAVRQSRRLSQLEPLAPQSTAVKSFLVKTTDLAALNPPSPDPCGIAYLPSSGRLVIVDGEVEETAVGITHFQNANVWELTRGGEIVRTANISTIENNIVPITNEPTGIAWNPGNGGHFYITDDDAHLVYDVVPGDDGLLGTIDDSWTYFSTMNSDPEGVAYDSWRDHILVADGLEREIYIYTTGGSLVSHFDVEKFGVIDPESVEFNPDDGTLLVMGSNSTSRVIVETTIEGALVQVIDISASKSVAAAGLAYAPASDGSGLMRFYIVDRGIDNNIDENEIDGKLFEMTAPPLGLVNKVYLPMVNR